MAASAHLNLNLLSPIVAGAWRLADWGWTPRQRLAWLEANVDLGVTSVDHADIDRDNGAEALLGEALALRPGLRARLQLVGSCVVAPDTSPGAVAAQLRAAVERSLQALGTDHLDLLLVHRPAPALDLDALAAALATECRAGRVRQVGLGQAAPAVVAGLHRRHPLAVHQVTLSPLQQQVVHDGTLAQCQALGLRPMAWAPLAGGRIFTGQDAAACRLRARLQALAAERGVAVTTLVIAWLLQHPSRPLPILGSRRISMAQEALAAQALRLDEATWQAIAAAAGDKNDKDSRLS
jgi:predicted oxidoreductase